MKKAYKDYDHSLIKSLKDPVDVAAYLNAALEENDPALFLMAYDNVTRAQLKKTSRHHKSAPSDNQSV